MKKMFADAWLVFGLIAVVLCALNPWAGWYSLPMLVIVLASWYVLRQYQNRARRQVHNREILKKLSSAQRQAYGKIEEREDRNLRSLSNMLMPLLVIGDAAITLYATGYDMAKGRLAALFSLPYADSAAACWCVAGFSALFLILHYLALREKIKMINAQVRS